MPPRIPLRADLLEWEPVAPEKSARSSVVDTASGTGSFAKYGYMTSSVGSLRPRSRSPKKSRSPEPRDTGKFSYMDHTFAMPGANAETFVQSRRARSPGSPDSAGSRSTGGGSRRHRGGGGANERRNRFEESSYMADMGDTVGSLPAMASTGVFSGDENSSQSSNTTPKQRPKVLHRRPSILKPERVS